MRIAFSELFTVNPATGQVSPKRAVQVGGITMQPGVFFTPGVIMAGVDIAANVGRDLEVEQDPVSGTVILKGIY